MRKEFWQVLKQRRSVRKFSDRKVPDGLIKKIIQAALVAPCGGGQRNLEFIVIKNNALKIELKKKVQERIDYFVKKMNSPRAKREFSSYGTYFTFFDQAPVVIAIILKPYDSLTGRMLEKYEGNLSYLKNAGIETVSAAIENMLLAVASLGLGACWMTGPLIAKESLEVTLKISLPNELLALIPIGYAKVNLPQNKLEKIKDYVRFV